MKKSLPVHPLPDRKNSFSIWVDKIRSKDQDSKKTITKPVIKSVYMSSGENLKKNWKDIQEKSEGKYLEKIHIMEEIRQKKIENKIIDLLYSYRYTCLAASESK